ncbi:MAG: RES domain-containing protein [Actinobacteria bacterium]|nr:RES domain-containing protein [Actinomycetota bacterium]
MIKAVAPPIGAGLWRIGREADPLAFSRPEDPIDATASPRWRFDSALGNYSTGYFATQPKSAFAEVLAALRPTPNQLVLLPDDDSMGDGHIDANWREQHRIAHVRLGASATRPTLEFVDLEDAATIADGHSHLTLAGIHGEDRTITCWISQIIHDLVDADGNHPFAGIRYVSKHGADFECWATFEDVALERLSISPIHRENPDLQAIATLF